MPPSLRNTVVPASGILARSCARCQCSSLPPSRPFSSTPKRNRLTRQRLAMFRWMNGPGATLKEHTPGSPNYLGNQNERGKERKAKEESSEGEGKDLEEVVEGETKAKEAEETAKPDKAGLEGFSNVPFPSNRQFESQAVLSEDLKEAVWYAVTQKGLSIRRASVAYRIDMRRVAAVVRLKEVEKKWEREGKRLATPYGRAILSMLPQTPLSNPPVSHESINDLPVHKSTLPQIFHPVAESRHFTRADAGAIFEKGLLPAEERIPHPELVAIEKARNSGMIEEALQKEEWAKIEAKDQAKRDTVARAKQRKEEATTAIPSGRWTFKFENVVVDRASVGRHVPGIGQRYGVPAQDRKKGQVKIPTSVE